MSRTKKFASDAEWLFDYVRRAGGSCEIGAIANAGRYRSISKRDKIREVADSSSLLDHSNGEVFIPNHDPGDVARRIVENLLEDRSSPLCTIVQTAKALKVPATSVATAIADCPRLQGALDGKGRVALDKNFIIRTDVKAVLSGTDFYSSTGDITAEELSPYVEASAKAISKCPYLKFNKKGFLRKIREVPMSRR